MDDQTSALDTYTEQALLQNINSIIKEKARTSVFIAHRLRTIYDSDQILVLKDGQVSESGTHMELLNQAGIYAELWHGKSPALASLIFQFSPWHWSTSGSMLTPSHSFHLAAQELSLAQDVGLEHDLAVEKDQN